MKIVVLDDDPFFLNVIHRQLVAALADASVPAPRIAVFSRSEDALNELAQAEESTHAFICDLQIPGMDGVEVLRQLRHAGFSGHVILVTGEDRRTLLAAQQLARAHGLRVAAALEKPVQLQALRAAVLDAPRDNAHRPPDVEAPTADQVATAIDVGQLMNHYQPKVDLATGDVTGMEALVRWDHPHKGLLAPFHFIGVAESAGLMPRLTDVVARKAVADMATWNRAGFPWCVAINVSMADLADLELPDRLAGYMDAAGIPLERLRLEVTEGQISGDPSVQLDVLTRLRLKRMGLSIDDFGTGFSSMARLRDLPFDELKIDRSFVHGIAGDADLQAFVSASVQLATELGMTSVAEGAERHEDVACLRRLGCHQVQGYGIARPMHPKLVLSWFSAWARRSRDERG